MSWIVLMGLVSILGLSLFAMAQRRGDLARMRGAVRSREKAVRSGAHKALLQHPIVDLSRCLGCATCVAACPEDGVLEMLHGQAMVVRGARCQGISACERECPVGAITVAIADLQERDDIPCLGEGLEAHGTDGLFLAGEVTAHALIKTAIEQGSAVAAEVSQRVEQQARHNGDDDPTFDLLIVGAGPAGLACALEAKRLGLRAILLDQEPVPGGTVAKYPRGKLILTQPVTLPLVGTLDRNDYNKEELIALWDAAVRDHELDFQGRETFLGLDELEGGGFSILTQGAAETHAWSARFVCLAIGRRGTPRKLGVPGEDLPKVRNSLLDARSHGGKRILVVGGGDSAVEAALGLAQQPGTEVILSYRKQEFFRLKERNEKRLHAIRSRGEMNVLTGSEVVQITADRVQLRVSASTESGQGRTETIWYPNDEVFILAGGVAPVELLTKAGVSFDPALRAAQDPLGERGTGLLRAVQIAFGLTLVALVWALWNYDYYSLERIERPVHDKHALLRPGMGFGLWMGALGVALIGLNLLYLLRRSPRLKMNVGSLQGWMTGHVATGVLAFLCVTLHSAMAPRNTPGGHAYWAIGVLLVTGAVGRYFYAWIPRAANGHELALAEVRGRLGRIAEEWDQGQRRFRAQVRKQVEELVEQRQWGGGFLQRIRGLISGQRDLRHLLGRMTVEGRSEGIDEDQLQETRLLAQRAYRTAVTAARYEDLRAVLGSWRYLHRWIALLMVLLTLLHVITSLAFGGQFSEDGR